MPSTALMADALRTETSSRCRRPLRSPYRDADVLGPATGISTPCGISVIATLGPRRGPRDRPTRPLCPSTRGRCVSCTPPPARPSPGAGCPDLCRTGIVAAPPSGPFQGGASGLQQGTS